MGHCRRLSLESTDIISCEADTAAKIPAVTADNNNQKTSQY